MSNFQPKKTINLLNLKIILVVGTLLAALFFGFVFIINTLIQNNDGYVFEPRLQRSYNPIFGDPSARVKVVYFTDLQCSSCKAQNPYLNEVKPMFKDKVQFVYKNNPLTSIHPFALMAAQTGNAINVQSQDKYFEFVNKMFASEERLDEKLIEKIAKDVGVDMEKLKKDKNSKKIEIQVKNDQKDLTNTDLPKSKTDSKANTKPKGEMAGTPTFVVFKDGQLYDWWTGVKNTTEFEDFLNKALSVSK
jgi:protein-disulfide isomerase